MLLAVDVDYRAGRAVAAGVLFRDWADAGSVQEIAISCPLAGDYVPGQFYRRELPCIEQLLRQLDALPGCIVIDGYVDLGPERRPGLGRHLYDTLEGEVAVIGVAKSAFRDTPAETGILRGDSQRPLHVTAAGMDAAEARRCIRRMHGAYRIPDLLRRADRLCRQAP